jgi:hypothetical protein
VLCGDSAWQTVVKNGILNRVLFGLKFNLKLARWAFGMKFEPQNFKFLWIVTYVWAPKRPVDLPFDVCLSVHRCICVEKKTN